MTAPRFSSRPAGLLVVVAAVSTLVAILCAGGARSASRAAPLIAFTRPDGVYVMHVDGSGARLLRRTGSTSWVTWSPDGRKLAYASFSYHKPSVRGGIWVMNADGTSATLVAKVSFLPSRPTWSPDSRRIAFAQPPGGHREIWIVNADGANLRRLTLPRLPRLGAAAVAWSPTGNSFAVAAGGWTIPGGGIYLVGADGDVRRNLTPGLDGEAGEPAWSPDARRIAFTSALPRQVAPGQTSLEPRDEEISVVSADGGSQMRLTNNHVPDYDPSWSPDGRAIVFVGAYAGSGTGGEIYLINADGTGLTRLTHNRISEASPSWQPTTR